jgi:hypothetical protein
LSPITLSHNPIQSHALGSRGTSAAVARAFECINPSVHPSTSSPLHPLLSLLSSSTSTFIHLLHHSNSSNITNLSSTTTHQPTTHIPSQSS